MKSHEFKNEGHVL